MREASPRPSTRADESSGRGDASATNLDDDEEGRAVPLTTEQALAHTQRLHGLLSRRRPDIRELEAYYRGEHPLRFASQEWREDHARRYEGFSDNWCGVVGSAPGERTEVLGFRIGDDTDVLDDDERLLMQDWHRNDMPAQASQGFLASSVSSRSSVIVWGDDDDEPVLTWEHPSQVIVDYDSERPTQRRMALKAWVDEHDGAHYATLYTADAVWKWKGSTPDPAAAAARMNAVGFSLPAELTAVGPGSWEPRDVDEPWPLSNPLGRVPVVEFQNRPILRHGPISDIRGTMAMQDAINLLWAYLFVAADFQSLPQRVVMGQQPPKIPVLDENGNQVGELPVDMERLRNGRLLWLTGSETSIGEFKAASEAFFLNTISVAARHIAAQTKTPIHLIHGELGNVNGETLAAMDAPLNGKVKESWKFYGPALREVFRLMALVRGNEGVAEACRDGRVQWANPETRSDAQLADAAVKDQSIGMPLSTILRTRYDMSQAEIDRILAEQADEAARALAAGVLRPLRQPDEPEGTGAEPETEPVEA